MVDGVLLLVDASEGPLPQTRFVLRKALEARLPVILVVNKVDRPDARIDEVVDEVYELFLDLDADESQIEFPIVYTNAKAGWRRSTHASRAPTSGRCSSCWSSTSRRPSTTPSTPPGARHQPRRLAVRRADRDLPRAPRHDPPRRDGRLVPRGRDRSSGSRSAELYVTEALERVEADEAAAGEIISVAGIPEITIGETLADADDPRPLPVITVDEPSLSVTIGINDLAAGRPGRRQADREPAQGAARARAGRQRLAARARRPTAPTSGRCRAAASWRWRCWSS